MAPDSRALAVGLLLLCMIGRPSIAAAQADLVVNPRTLQFRPSTDHLSVQRYELEIFPGTAGVTPVAVVNLGKPTPEADGQIRVNLIPWSLDQSLLPGTYLAKVSATSDGGVAESTASNPFTFSVACTYLLGVATPSFLATAGTQTVSVTTSPGCVWSTTNTLPWISVTGGSGTGNGTVTLTVLENTAPAIRSGTLTIAGQVVTATQAAATPCTYSVTPTSSSPLAIGGTGTITVTTAAGCPWGASSPASWITFGPSTGSGSGSATYTVLANTATTARQATLTVAGQPVSLTQAGATPVPAPASCTYTVSPTSLALTAGGRTGTVAVTTATGCAWTASSPVSWLTFAPSTGSGSGSATYTIVANTATTARQATLTVAGQPVSLTQAGATPTPTPGPASCTYTVSPTSLALNAQDNTGTITVTTADGCAWTSSSPASWMTFRNAGTSRNGSGNARYTVSANTSTAVRQTTVTVAGKTVSVSQAGAASSPAPNPTPSGSCSVSLSPSVVNVEANGQKGLSGFVVVTAAPTCAWTTVENSSWITVTSGSSGSGTGLVRFTAAPNETGQTRTSVMTVNGKQVTILQAK